jgi:lipoprotein signal peptidase
MLGILVALVIGCVVGLVRGGSFRRLEKAHVRRLPLVFVGVGFQIASTVSEQAGAGWLAFACTLGSFGCVAWFAFENRREVGMPLIAFGAVSNLAVIIANGGMPVSIDAIRRSGRGPHLRPTFFTRGSHEALVDSSRLSFLADVIPLRYGTVVSVGDLLIWAGMILLLQQLMVGPRGRHVPAPASRD